MFVGYCLCECVSVCEGPAASIALCSFEVFASQSLALQHCVDVTASLCVLALQHC